MGTITRRPLASSSRTSKRSFHSQRFALHAQLNGSPCLTRSLSFQFFTQSNPLNNLNITSSIPPILQRQNSAPNQQQPVANQINGDFYKPGNVHRTAAPSHATPSTAGEIHRKYSLPMSTLSSQPMVSASSFSQQMMRKQSAPSIQSMTSSQQHFQQQPHGSPSRARDRNNFDKAPSNQEVQQLPLLKGGLKLPMLTLFSFIRKAFCSVYR